MERSTDFAFIQEQSVHMVAAYTVSPKSLDL